MSVHLEETQVVLPDGARYTLSVLKGENDGSGGGLVQVFDEDGDPVLLLTGGWAALLFSGAHRQALLTWVLSVLQTEYTRGVKDGEAKVQTQIRKTLGL